MILFKVWKDKNKGEKKQDKVNLFIFNSTIDTASSTCIPNITTPRFKEIFDENFHDSNYEKTIKKIFRKIQGRVSMRLALNPTIQHVVSNLILIMTILA